MTGGAPVVVTVLRQSLGNGVGAAWGSDGRIVLTTAIPVAQGLQQVFRQTVAISRRSYSATPPAEQDFFTT